MKTLGDHIPVGRTARIMLVGLIVGMIASCARDNEAAMRARLEQWFSIGETVAFNASGGCAAAAFRLVDMQVKSTMSVVHGVPQALQTLPRRGKVTLNDPDQTPDAALVDLANADRATGMGMRRVAFEARACMDDITQSAFRYALVNPKAMLAYDAEHAALMLLDPRTGVLVVAMGAG